MAYSSTVMTRAHTSQAAAAGTAAAPLPSRRIAADLRAAIEAGELTAGQKLPSERDLAAQYGTARNTAREAIRLLETAGLVDVEQGRGVFVHRPAPLIRLGSDRYSRQYRDSGLSPFLLECAKQGKIGRFEVLSIQRGQPPQHVADALRVPAGQDSVLIRENIFWADNDPVHRVTTYIPWHDRRRDQPSRRGGPAPLRHPRHPRRPRPRHGPVRGERDGPPGDRG